MHTYIQTYIPAAAALTNFAGPAAPAVRVTPEHTLLALPT